MVQGVPVGGAVHPQQPVQPMAQGVPVPVQATFVSHQQPMWQHRPAPAHHDPLRDIYGPMSCSGGEAGCCSWRCFSVIHLLVEAVEGAIFGVCAFVWSVIMVFGSSGIWNDAAATNLLIGPWNAAAAAAVLVVVSFVSCVCCCVGERAVKAYKVAMLVGAAIASLRFLGALLLLGGGEEHCADPIYMYDPMAGDDYVYMAPMSDAILSENARCPRGFTFPTSAEACAEAAAAAMGHPLSADVQEQCDRDPCASADVEHYAGDPICSALPHENLRIMYVPEGSRASRQDGYYYQAVCVAGGDERLNGTTPDAVPVPAPGDCPPGDCPPGNHDCIRACGDAGVPVPEAHLTPVPGSGDSNCWHSGGVDEDDWGPLFVLVVWTVAIVSLRCAGLCLANRWKQPAAPPQVVSGAVIGVAHGP